MRQLGAAGPDRPRHGHGRGVPPAPTPCRVSRVADPRGAWCWWPWTPRKWLVWCTPGWDRL